MPISRTNHTRVIIKICTSFKIYSWNSELFFMFFSFMFIHIFYKVKNERFVQPICYATEGKNDANRAELSCH